jgi:hypothetical protein
MQFLSSFGSKKVWLSLWDLNATFNNISYIATVSFIGGGNWSTWRKPPTSRKSLSNFIT